MSTNDSSLLGWVLAGVATIVASLTTALSWIYRHQISSYENAANKLETRVESLEAKLDKCHEEHVAAKLELGKLSERTRLLEARGCAILEDKKQRSET
jgi:cell division protein FtsL